MKCRKHCCQGVALPSGLCDWHDEKADPSAYIPSKPRPAIPEGREAQKAFIRQAVQAGLESSRRRRERGSRVRDNEHPEAR